MRALHRAPTIARMLAPSRILLAAATIVASGGLASEARAQCVDEELKEELVGGRHYRGVQDRLFTKAFRHEISAMGGLYAADLYSSRSSSSSSRGCYTEQCPSYLML